jgi:hypothetical protein
MVTSTVYIILNQVGVFEISLHRARYGVMLEKGAFDKRTADFLWMMIFGAISLLVSGSSFYNQNFRLGETKRHS